MVLRRSGSHVAFRNSHQDVALAAGRRRVFATSLPSVLRTRLSQSCSRRNSYGADPTRRNNFLYYADDTRGFKCPTGSHARRINSRDQFKDETIQVNRHRLIRRGIFFVFIGADLKRQFEFVRSEWVNQRTVIGAPAELDPAGSSDGTGMQNRGGMNQVSGFQTGVHTSVGIFPWATVSGWT